MKKNEFGRRCRVAFVTALIGLAESVHAQPQYPSRPIRLIVPFPPGGSTKVIARLMGQRLSENFGQQIVVDNRGGGNTIIGSEAMVRAAPDGYTLLHVTGTHVINPSLLKVPYDPVRDFAPVATMVSTETLIVVTRNVPATTLQEFIAYAKSRPGQLNFASSGSGTTNHLSIELLSILTGIKMQHIPHKGAGPALTDLMGGQVQLFTNNPLPLIPLVKAGKIRALAVSGSTRLRSLPDVPTVAESGVQGFDVRSWQGILAPARTPSAIIDRLANEIGRILRLPEVNDNFLTMGADVFISTPAEFSQLIKRDLARYAKLIKDANIRIE